jgi:septal ring factor EnvC (AmiA/AmiB activator)
MRSRKVLQQQITSETPNMKMLSKIALVISILACAGALYLAHQLGGERDGLQADLGDTRTKLRTTEGNLETERANHKATTDQLAEKTSKLAATESALNVENQRVKDLEGQVAEVNKAKDDLTKALDTTKSELTVAKKEVETLTQKMADARPEEVARLRDDLDKVTKLKENLTGENQILTQKLKGFEKQVADLGEEIKILKTTPQNLRGKVVMVQPEWGFMVLDVGHRHRVQPNSEFIVYRNDQLVTKVKVVDVKEANSIAEFMRGFQKLPPQVGDTVVY